MDTNKLKRFAPEARTKLINAVEVKLDYVLTAKTPDLAAAEKLLGKLRKAVEREGREQVVERVAYTWFNRLAALRYLDARGWHPFRLRVLTSAGEDAVQPELLQQVRQGVIPDDLQEFISAERVNNLLDGKLPSDNPQAEVQRLLVLAACRFYHALLPNLFEKIDDETELLLPEDLLTEHSTAHGFRTEITDEDCSEVEVLGWLYQFYISDKKDEVMARKKAVPTEDIPAVTQLFTPHWIVRYLVENSLGRLWLRSRPHSGLREHMPYYVEDPVSDPPAWQKQWREEGLEARDGDYRSLMWLRPNPDLKDDYYESLGYAITIDGYAYAQDNWRIDATSGEDVRKFEELEAVGWDKLRFEDLRFCLFMVQRAIKWTDDRDGSLTEKYHAIYDAICTAWDREWQKHQAELPDLSRYGIRLPEAASADSLTVATPEEIKLLDPACGSGHMLTYAFDLLVKIYEEEGHAPSEIPEKILTHNLFGLEICPRAAQLAQLALVCKAREQSRTAFRRPVQPQVMCLQNVAITPDEMQAWSAATGVKLGQDELAQLHQFREHTETFGALIQPVLTEDQLTELKEEIGESSNCDELFIGTTHQKIQLVLKQATMLLSRYNIVLANPPYMGAGSYNSTLKDFVNSKYNAGKADLYSCFMLRNASFLVDEDQFLAMITIPNWMTLGTFEKFRGRLLQEGRICQLLHFGRGVWGSDFGSCAFIISNSSRKNLKGVYRRLFKKAGEVQHNSSLERNFFNQTEYLQLTASADEFLQVPGTPIAYSLSPGLRALFQNPRLEATGHACSGIQTGDNELYLRYWFEVSAGKIHFSCHDYDELVGSGRRWLPHKKGGEFRKWYGNNEYVIDWENDGEAIKSNPSARPQNLGLMFGKGATWSHTTAGGFGARIKQTNETFNVEAPCHISDDPLTVCGFLNSKVSTELLAVLAPTLHYLVGVIKLLPSPPLGASAEAQSLAREAVEIAKEDWNSFERSWDFNGTPFLSDAHKANSIRKSWENWKRKCLVRIARTGELEETNNRFFIEHFGLSNELSPDINESQITLARADPRKDMAAFLSYTVGCMMGRYSLDHPRLILADTGDTLEQYFEKVGKSADEVSFLPDDDAIIPITEDDWFEDDAASRVREFLRITFGPETLDENVAFLEESLGKDLRKYFTANTGGFYADHLQTYKKRPIYWMFQSPKKHFRALVYLHRYTKDTVNTLLNGYLREFNHKLTNKISDLEAVGISEDATAKEKTAANKALKKAKDALKDVEDYERDIILPLAQQRLEIDLDDGVKANYPKFGKALAKVSGLS